MSYKNSQNTLANLYQKEYVRNILESGDMGLGILSDDIVDKVLKIPISEMSDQFPHIASRLYVFPTLNQDLEK